MDLRWKRARMLKTLSNASDLCTATVLLYLNRPYHVR